MTDSELVNVGFWPRVDAALIDTLLLSVVTWPLLTTICGSPYWVNQGFIRGPADFLLSRVFPEVAVNAFWVAKQTTPGKMAIYARIVDLRTGQASSVAQLVVRYVGYYLASLSLFVGIIWVGLRRKQGWYDKLAGAVVVRKHGPELVVFEQP